MRQDDVKNLQKYIGNNYYQLNGTITLHEAVYYNALHCVQMLLDNKTTMNFDYWSIVNWIGRVQSHKMVFLLIERCPLNAKDCILSEDRLYVAAIQRQLANCRSAQLALARCLRGLVHRDIIPQVADAVWSTRRNAQWK